MSFQYKMGYLPDLVDFRDLTLNTVKQEVLPKTLDITNTDLPRKVDNHRYCSPVENQLNIGSCVAHACVSAFEYMERRASNNHIDGSRLFVYWNARKYGNFDTNQDTGTFIRSGLKAIIETGIPEESLYPYIPSKFKDEPSAFLYSNAQNFKTTKYIRIDDGNGDPVLKMKNMIAQGFPIIGGFTVYESINDVTRQIPVLPMPSQNEKVLGGHAIYMVSFDDDAPSYNSRDGNRTTGAFGAINSWGNWGDNGMFWIPYDIIRKGIMADIWSISDISWINSKQFD